MTDIRRIGEAGVHTVEGNVAGSRAAMLTKQREQQSQEYELLKNKIKAVNSASISRIDDKFSSASDVQEQEFRRRTVGLVTADEFRKAKEEGNLLKEKEHQELIQRAEDAKQQKESDKSKERETKRRKIASTLSFNTDDNDNEEEEIVIPKRKSTFSAANNNKPSSEVEISSSSKKSLKNPFVDTSFLPDPEREKELQSKREALQKEWLAQQEIIKQEVINI